MDKKLLRRKRGRPPQQSKIDIDHVLSIALRCYANKGYEGTRMNEIAEQAGCSKSLMNYHFNGKEDVWMQAVSKLGEKLHARYQRIEGYFKDLSGLVLMKALNRQFIYFSAEHPEFYKIVFHEMCNPSERTQWLLDEVLFPLHKMSELRMSTTKDGDDLLLGISHAHLFSLLIGAANVFFIHSYENKRLYGVDVFDEKEIERYADFVNQTVFARFEK